MASRQETSLTQAPNGGDKGSRLIARSHSLSKYLSLLSIIFPLLSAIGWVFEIPLLTQGHPALPAMQPNTILGLVLGALGMLAFREEDRPPKALVTCALAAVVSLIGLLTICEYLFDWNPGIDQIFISSAPMASHPYPGRPSPQAAFNFLLLGFALISFNLSFIHICVGQVFAILIGFNALVAATGYIFSTTQFYKFPVYVPEVGMAVHTSAGFIFLAGALLFSRPSKGMMVLVTSGTRSGGIARRVLLSAVVLPPFVGALTRIGVVGGWYDVGVQVSLFAVVIVGLIIWTTWKAAMQAEKEERRAITAQRETLLANERLQRAVEEREIFAALIENSSDFIGIADPNGKPIYINRAGFRMVGLPDNYPIENTQILEYYPVDQRTFASEVIVKAMMEKGRWHGETYFRNWKTGDSIPVSHDHFMIQDSRTKRILGTGTVTRDISEIKLAQAQIREAHERYDLALRGADLATWDWNIQTGTVAFNPRWAELRGLRFEEVKPHVDTWVAGIHPEDWPRVQKELKDYFEGVTPNYSIEFRVLTKSKEWIWILDRGRVFARDAQGKPIRMVGTELDITDRKRREAEQKFLADVAQTLASSLDYEETLKNIAHLAVRDYADLCILNIYEEGDRAQRFKVVSRDPSLERICDLLNQTSADARRSHTPSAVFETKQPLLIEELSSEMLASICHSDDHFRELQAADLKSILAIPLTAHGREVGVIAFLFSASARPYKPSDIRLANKLANRFSIALEKAWLYRESQRAKLILDSLPAMIAYWDNTQRCRFANRAYLDWFGFSPEQLLGRTMVELLGPKLYEENLPYINGAIQGVRQDFERDLNLISTGEIRHTNATYLPDVVDGKVLGFFVMVFDVTDLKKAQLLAISEKEKAMAAIKTREEVLAIVSHDLKNPLASVGLSAQLLQKTSQVPASRVYEYAGRIQRSVDQMQTLIDDLLDFGKIQSGTFSVEKVRVNPIDIVLAVTDGVRPLAEAKRLHLVIEVASTLPDVACAANRIGQVLSNLLGNAIKFTPEGGTVRLIAVEEQDGVLISVCDTGPGIPPEQLPKVFDRFWQARKTKHLGSGLGLSIAKGIIDAHGAKIWADSQVGKGSCFSFTIPFATAETKVRKTEGGYRGTPGRLLEGIHVMLVDDSPDVLYLTSQILKNTGARVTEASSVTEALSKVIVEKPNLMIVDIEMPDGNGYDLIEKVHQMTKKDRTHIPVVAFTAHTDDKELKKISDAGFDAHLSKPVLANKLISSIRRLVGGELSH